MAETPAPIFILSTARAGSTLLRYVIDTHPRVYVPAEVYLGHLACSLYRTLAGLAGEGIFVPTPFHLEQHPEIVAQVRETLAELMASAAHRKGKDVWCEKSPDNLEHLDLLLRLFPDARYICLYRYYRDVMSSCLEVCRYGFITVLEEYIRRSPANTLEAIACYWLDAVTAQLELERRAEVRTCRLLYEDLVADPERTLPSLFSFLELDWRPELLAEVFRTPHDAGIGDGYVRYSGRIRQESVGKGAALPLERLSAAVSRRLEQTAESLGYGSARATVVSRSTTVAAPVRPAPAVVPGGGRAVRLLFESVLPARLATFSIELLPDTSVCFEITGEGGGSWVLQVGDDGIQVIPGSTNAACRLTLSAADLLAVMHGRSNALHLVEQGRIRVLGAVSDAALQQLVQLLRTDV